MKEKLHWLWEKD